ncbi:MAG: hypothetical protein K2X44_08395 [Magnetospirillum sp.]|nr:hypothetical protein [Magnetospirillum sp.]
MQAKITRMSNSLDRLSAAVQSMQDENVSCRRALMVFRARMDAAEQIRRGMQEKLDATCAVLAEAEAGARKAAEISRATVAGVSAQD